MSYYADMACSFLVLSVISFTRASSFFNASSVFYFAEFELSMRFKSLFSLCACWECRPTNLSKEIGVATEFSRREIGPYWIVAFGSCLPVAF